LGRKFLALVLGVGEGIAREGLELIKAQVGMTGVKRAVVVAKLGHGRMDPPPPSSSLHGSG
jgi:hypothetical protein